MASSLAAAALVFSRKRRRWILLLGAAGLSGYGAYRVYHLPSVTSKCRKLTVLIRALISAAEAVAVVSDDLNRFLRSDSDEIPASLKQVSKIAKSDEFSVSLSRVSEAITIGILRGFGSGSKESELKDSSSGFSDKIMDKLLSTSGSGFASVVVGSFARNLVIGFYSTDSGGVSGNWGDEWVDLICSDRCRDVIARSIQLFVSTAVTVFLDKTMEINTYDEIFAGLTNPKHDTKMKDLLVSVCNGAVETLVKTSHRVLAASDSNPSGSKQEVELNQEPDRRSLFDCRKGAGGWFDQVSSTLAVPSNRKFVIDVSGRVTFETVRLFLDFLLWKLYDGARRGVSVVQEEVVMRGFEVIRYASAKSMAIFMICLTLCMHVLMGTRLLMPS